jgi:hypothetical protein
MALDLDRGAIVVRPVLPASARSKIPRAMCLSRGVVFASLGEDRTCQFQNNRSLIEALRSWYPLRKKGHQSGFAWSWLGAAMQATSLPFGGRAEPEAPLFNHSRIDLLNEVREHWIFEHVLSGAN